MIPTELAGLARVQAAIAALEIKAEIVSPGQPMPTVPLAAEAVGRSVDQIIKTVVFTDGNGSAIVAIANGINRINRQKLAVAVGVSKLKLATPEFVLERTGYPAGGVSPIGIRDVAVRIILDQRVLDQSEVYGGAGTEDDLLRISTETLRIATSGLIGDITD